MSIRSLLVVPPLKPDVVLKAVDSAADALLIELEDGIHADRKDEARDAVVDFFRSGAARRKQTVVRINDVLHPAGLADLYALAAADATDLMLPKVRTLAEVEHADAILKRAEGDAARPIYSVRLWVMLETTEGVLNAVQILSHRRIRGFLMGAADLSAELFVKRIGLGAERQLWDFPMELLYAKQHALLAARAAGAIAIDTCGTNFRDLDATASTASAAAQMGFDGCLVLSPRQLDATHAAFTPTDEDYKWALDAIMAVRNASKRGESVALLNNEMVEGPLIRNAHSIVRRYERANPDRARPGTAP